MMNENFNPCHPSSKIRAIFIDKLLSVANGKDH